MEFLKLSAYLQSKFGSNYKSVIYKSVKFYNQNLAVTINPWSLPWAANVSGCSKRTRHGEKEFNL